MSDQDKGQKLKLPKWLIEMLQDTLDMRDAQNAYFQQPADYRLKISKAKERKVDEKLDYFIREGHISRKVSKPSIPNTLF